MRTKYLEKIPKKTNKKTITFIKLESSSKFVRPNNFEVESSKQISSTSDPTQELEDLLHRSWTLKPAMKKKKKHLSKLTYMGNTHAGIGPSAFNHLMASLFPANDHYSV